MYQQQIKRNRLFGQDNYIEILQIWSYREQILDRITWYIELTCYCLRQIFVSASDVKMKYCLQRCVAVT
jgi:hypothetical protein